MHMKELMKLRALHDKASEFFASLQWKKESFELLSHDEKIYSIVKNMEQMLEEVGGTWLIYNKQKLGILLVMNSYKTGNKRHFGQNEFLLLF